MRRVRSPLMARRSLAVLAVVVAALVAPAGAAAHGPCGCTWPAVAEPGQRVRTATGYKVVWNPAARDFRNQTTPDDLASGYRADAPTAVVLRRSRRRPLRRATFRVPPRTPPGIYFVLVFDGSEGGAHTTWDYVQVLDRPKTQAEGGKAPTRQRSTRGGAALPVALGAAALILVVLAVALRRRRRARLA